MPIREAYIDDFYRRANVAFLTTHHDLGRHGPWIFLRPSPVEHECLSIWHVSDPLRPLRNNTTAHIIKHMAEDLRNLLEADSVFPVQVSRCWLKPISSAPDIDTEGQQMTSHNIALRLTFEYVVNVSRIQAKSSGFGDCTWHLQWSDNADIAVSYPNPFISFFSTDTSSHSKRSSALLLLMRSPWLYDAGSDYMFERYLKLAMSMLFDSSQIQFLSPETDCIIYPACSELNSPPQVPLVVACGSTELTESIRGKMAAAAHPTLVSMLKKLGSETAPLPQYCFVYGLHWSRSRLSIFLHFPSLSSTGDTPGQWEFRQVLAAEHWVTLQETPHTYCAYMDEMYMQRWRLTVACFTVLKHVEFLEQWMQGSRGCTESTVKMPIDFGPVAVSIQYLNRLLKSSSLTGKLETMYSCWSGPQLPVPIDWMPSESGHIRALDYIRGNDDEITLARRVELTETSLRCIRTCLQPIPLDAISSSRINNKSFTPDFMHSTHLPRSADVNYVFLPMNCLVGSTVDTRFHLHKTYDVLTVPVSNWHDMNILFAYALADSADYRVRWRPRSRYPLGAELDRTESLAVACDFALVVAKVSPTTDASIRRACDLPPTISSPAVLFGTRQAYMSGDGDKLTSREVGDLRKLMRPHLDLLSKHLDLLRSNKLLEDPTLLPQWAVLFCTHMKAGYLHILAFAPAQDPNGDPPEPILLDSLPVAMQADNSNAICGRLRVALALFTLQRHVVQFAEQWDDSVWPLNIIEDEYAWVVEETGVATPTPTAYLPPGDENTSWWDQPASCSVRSDDSCAIQPDETHWEWLKRAAAHYGERDTLESMQRLQAWIEQYDPKIFPAGPLD